jgi:DNA-binding response OmpR family regulator
VTCTVCHACGAALEPLEPFSLGKLFVDKAGAHVWWGEKPVRLSPAEKQIVLTLVRADGRIVKRAILAEVSGYDGDEPNNIAAVYVSRSNAKFREIDPAFDRIETLRGEGVRWRTEA